MTKERMNAVGHTCLGLIVFAGLASVAPLAVSAQQPQALRCASLLTGDEIQRAVGETFANVDALSRRAGSSECAWIARGPKGAKSVFVEFFDLTYIKSGPDGDNTLESFFTRMAEPSATANVQPLPGVGLKAVVVRADPQRAAYVQLADGVARIVTNNLTEAQVVAVARAVASP
jgi:hypothetical protein